MRNVASPEVPFAHRLEILDLGLKEYEEAWEFQKSLQKSYTTLLLQWHTTTGASPTTGPTKSKKLAMMLKKR